MHGRPADPGFGRRAGCLTWRSKGHSTEGQDIGGAVLGGFNHVGRAPQRGGMDLRHGGLKVGSESCAHHHRYTRRQLPRRPWRPASCLRAAPRQPGPRLVGAVRLERRRRRRQRNRECGPVPLVARTRAREGDLRGRVGRPAAKRTSATRAAAPGVAGLEVNGEESRWPETRFAVCPPTDDRVHPGSGPRPASRPIAERTAGEPLTETTVALRVMPAGVVKDELPAVP